MRRLERRGKLFVHLALLLFLAGAALFVYLPQRDALRQQAVDNLQQVADGAAQVISHRLQNVVISLQAVSGSLEASGQFPDAAAVARLGFSRIGLADQQGEAVYSDGGRGSVSGKAWLTAAQHGEVDFATPITIDRGEGDLVAVVAMPFGHEQVLIGEMDTLAWSGVFGGLTHGENGYVFALGADGTTIYHPDLQLVLNNDNDFSKNDPSLAELIALEKRMVAGERGVGPYTYRATERYLAFAPILGTGWSVAAVLPTEELFGVAWQWRDRVLYASGLLIAIAAIFLFRSTQVRQTMMRGQATLVQIIDAMPAGFAVVDEKGGLALTNQPLRDTHGLPDDPSLVGWSLNDLISANDRQKATLALARAFASGSAVQEHVLGLRSNSGTFEALLAISPLHKDSPFGKAATVVVTDLSAQQRQAQLLLASEERFYSVFSTMPQGLLIGELLYDDPQAAPVDVVLTEINPSASKMLQVNQGDKCGYWLNAMPALDDGLSWLEMLGQLVIEGGSRYVSRLCLDGVNYFDLLFHSHRHGQVAVFVSDVTERAQAEVEIHRLSMHDSLTGIGNRHAFDLSLQQLQDNDQPVGILQMDIDGLRIINKALGTDTADQVLVEVAQRLSQVAGTKGTVARLGGDGYGMLLLGVTRQDLDGYVAAVRHAMEEYNRQHGMPIPVSLSIGVAHSMGEMPVQNVMRLAEDNLYREKLYRDQSSRSAAVMVLNRALEARDFNTEGHARRLQTTMERFAQRIGLGEAEIIDLKLLAQFHDIGKVGTPDSILFKPGRLTPEEWVVMKQHCLTGSRIAESSRDLLPIADLILKHHERWDGGGYPLGISGEAIPLACRILAIVDTYDAMTNDRPYRRALTHTEAVAEIRNQSGLQFDPSLVESLVPILEECYLDNEVVAD